MASGDRDSVADMPDTANMNIEITGERVASPSRRCWVCRDGTRVTVEAFVGAYYLEHRHCDHYLIDTSCVYGGLLWVLFPDVLFHTNLTARHPLRRLFYTQPRQGYARYQAIIEDRLAHFATNRAAYLQDAYQRFYAHPIFHDPASHVPAYVGSWARRHEQALVQFCRIAPEHGMEDLIREILLTSVHGVNRGWPDLVVWSADQLIFAEVKTSDQLSPAQVTWFREHSDQLTLELVRVKPVEAHPR